MQTNQASPKADAGQNSDTFEIIHETTREELSITRGEMKRHIYRVSRIEEIWKQIVVSDVKFRQIKSARAEI